MVLGPPPTLLEYNNMKFVITNLPECLCLEPYINDLVKYNTQKLLKVCDANYDKVIFDQYGITVEELIFENGSFPSDEIIEKWLLIVESHFLKYPGSALAVQCEYGLGRSPVLIAIALIENGMTNDKAIDFVRSKRRGAFNTLQHEKLKAYIPHNNPTKIQNHHCSIS